MVAVLPISYGALSANFITLGLPIISAGLVAGSLILLQAGRARDGTDAAVPPPPPFPRDWPRSWLVVRGRSLDAVRSALGLRHSRACSWGEGLAGVGKLFVARPVKGWILVAGPALPDPSEDVDACFRWVCGLSEQLGQVQFFRADVAVGHHAWIKAKRGRIVRAYAWAGETVWNQGPITFEEKALGLGCFDYTVSAERLAPGQEHLLQTNCEKVVQLAACWGVAPSDLGRLVTRSRCGIAGETSGGV